MRIFVTTQLINEIANSMEQHTSLETNISWDFQEGSSFYGNQKFITYIKQPATSPYLALDNFGSRYDFLYVYKQF
jgi:hypothetical protein